MSQYYFHEDREEICGRTFQGGYGARMLHPDGRPFYTFRTYTVLADGSGISFRDCCFENSAGPGETAGQAIALYLDGDEITLTNCVLRGHQDTLFLAPLPLKPFLKNGFVGPKEFTPRTDRTVYFKNCLIEGGIDFIFGGATAYFDDCEFRNVEPGYVFAPCTPEGKEEGFVARNCRFTAAENVPEARMFRPLVKALFFGSDLSSEEDKSDLAFIEEQPDCRQKRYVNGLIASVIHQEQPKEAIDILSDARENHGVGNVNYLLGNLYETLARGPRKMKKTEVPVASGSGKKWTWVKKKKNTKEEYLRSASFYYLQAFSNGETKSPAMYDYAADQLLADAKQRSLLAMGIVLLVSIPVLFLLFMMDHEGAMTAKEKWDLLFKIIGINMAVYLGLFLLMELISAVKKLNMKKRSGKMKKEMK